LVNSADDIIGSLRRNREHTTEMAAAVDNFDVEADDDGFVERCCCLAACSADRRAAAEEVLDIILDEIIVIHSLAFSIVMMCCQLPSMCS